VHGELAGDPPRLLEREDVVEVVVRVEVLAIAEKRGNLDLTSRSELPL
jgi:hypothetical protein